MKFATFIHGRRKAIAIAVICAVNALGLGQVACAAPTGSMAMPLVSQTISDAYRVQLTGNTHPLARAEFDRGRLADSFVMEHVLLALKRSPEQEQVLAEYIDELHNPDSPHYQQWLTAEQLGTLFGSAQQDIDKVTSWLQSHGLKVNSVYSGHMMIDFSGTAGQIRAAFNSEMHSYDVLGQQHIANASDPQIPAALAPVVQGIVSLHDFFPHPQIHNVGAVRKDAQTGQWTRADEYADFTFSYGGSEQYDVTPQDFAKIYNVASLWSAKTPITGKGQTIVVIEDTNIKNTSDVTAFRNAFGLSAYSGTFAQIHPSSCTSPGVNAAEGEAALDAEWAAAVAPDATIELASCKDTATTFGGLIAAENLLNGNNPPPIMSVSYGECESANGSSANAAYNTAWQQAAAEGVSVYVSAGDEGSVSCDADQSYAQYGIAVSGFASTSYNVAVGGTDFGDTVNGTTSTYWNASSSATYASAKSYIPEIPWNNSCASSILYTHEGYTSGVDFCNSTTGKADFLTTASGSGGPSSVHSKPSWQSGVNGIVGDGKRDLPDISLFAASGVFNHALIFCMSDSAQGGKPCTYSNSTDAIYNSAGGTSFAAPAFAGIQALINQKKGGKSQGNPNPRLYALAATEYGSSASPNASKLSSCNSTNGHSVGSTCVFYDVTVGDIDVPCKKGTPNCYVGTSTKTYGVTSTSTSSLKPAYPATAGWDFATGLGTVNVTNLVNAW